MNNNLIFFCIASTILLFSIIAINLAPYINGLVGKGLYDINGDVDNGFVGWGDYSCGSISDRIKYLEDTPLDKTGHTKESRDEEIKTLKRGKKRCNRQKAMAGLEYVSFNLSLIFGFVCALLGFLQYLDIKKIEISGIIGLGCGVVGFVLTLVYVIESGLVFNDYVNQGDYRIDSNGAIIKWNKDKGKYTCIYYDKDDATSLIIRYSDYGNKYLSYRTQLAYLNTDKYKDYELKGCQISSFFSSLSSPSYGMSYFGQGFCKMLDEKNSASTKQKYYDDNNNEKGECEKIFYVSQVSNNVKKNLYDHWLTTIIFSCFNFLLYIGLAIFGFLLFNTSGQTNI